MNRYTIAFLILGGGLALLILNHGNGETFGVDNDSFARIVRLLPIATVLAAGILAGSRFGIGKTLRYLGLWFLIALGLVTIWLYRGELQAIGNRVAAGLIPGRAVVVSSIEGEEEVILHKTMGGHFAADVEVNGRTLSMMVDTGASMVALSWEDARRVGLNPENLNYSMTVMTANGRASAAPVTLAQVAIGPIERRNVAAMVAAEDRLERSLLGMSFLSTLSSLRMESDELRLRN